MSTYVALLRGVNVGGKSMVSMADLRSVFSSLGHQDVTTYLQSGNVVFRCGTGGARQIADRVERQISKACGLDVAVLLRTPAELRKIVDGNPFRDEEADAAKLHVVFLDARPAAAAKARLDPDRSPPDRYDVRGREIYLHLPSGSARSKLTIDYFERTLGTDATARNWRTVTKLLALVKD